jgi:hypothetical protein
MARSPCRLAGTVRSVAALGVVAVLAGCADEPSLNGEGPVADAEAERMDLEGLLEAQDATEETDGAVGETVPDPELMIDPGTMLGPGLVTTRVGDVAIAFDLPEAVEGGTVAPPDLPVALELIDEGGVIVVFEAVGHTRADDPIEAEHGLPDDLAAWLENDLPEQLHLADGPAAIGEGVAVSLHNLDDQQTLPVVLWRVEGSPIDTFEGHGPPPDQTQHLWLRNLDGAWVGVATYGQDTDPDLAEQVALSLRRHQPG